MITTLVVVLSALLIFAGIPFYFINKMSDGRGGGTSSLDIGGKLKPYIPNYEHFGHAIGLFIVLFLVLWLTDDKLGWLSFMIRDWWTFAAFVITYLVFAPALMQEKDKRKKTSFFKTAMVFTTILAVDLALIGMSPANIFDWWWSRPNQQSTAQVASPPARVVETIIASGDHFTYKNIPDGVSIEFFCPNGTLMDFTYSGIPEEERGFIDCDTGGRNLVLGAYKTGRSIGFMSKDANQKLATVTTIARGS